MISSIEELKKLVDDTDINAEPTISYKEWLICLKSLLTKIMSNEHFDYRGVGSLILLVEVTDMNDENLDNYNYYCKLLRKFFGLYQYGYDGMEKIQPIDCWKKVVNNPEITIEPLAFRPLK